jgi:hypothetical protein
LKATAVKPFEPDGIKEFTLMDMADRMGVARRTIFRYVRSFKAKPIRFYGYTPVFDLATFKQLEARKNARMMKRRNYAADDYADARDGGSDLITVKEAKRRARK